MFFYSENSFYICRRNKNNLPNGQTKVTRKRQFQVTNFYNTHKIMKYTATFKEIAEIFGALAKAEKKMEERTIAENTYNEALHAYTANGCEASAGAVMRDAYDDMKKADDGLRHSFNKILDLMEIDRKAFAGTDAYYCKLAGETYHPLLFFLAMRREALELAKTI